MRNIIDVIQSIKTEVPEDQIKFHNFLNWLMNDASYKAPEQIVECWNKFARGISNHIIKPPTEDWQFRALSIFSGMPEKELRKYYNSGGE